MRGYVLTPREKKILEEYLETGIKLDGFSVLVVRLKRAHRKLGEDMKLIEATLEKLMVEALK